jgi:predicted DNA-binding transcriptional regulator AlpA
MISLERTRNSLMQTLITAGTDAAEQFLPARQVWERYGVTQMCLWRWLKDADLKFPQPMRIGRLRYWRLSDLAAWERARIGKSVAEIDLEAEQPAALNKERGA